MEGGGSVFYRAECGNASKPLVQSRDVAVKLDFPENCVAFPSLTLSSLFIKSHPLLRVLVGQRVLNMGIFGNRWLLWRDIG